MERLTDRCWKNLDPWETCGQDGYCQRGCHEEGGCTKGCLVPKLYSKLATYEDLDEQGLVLRLPCKEVFESSGDNVYYIFDYEIIECVNCGVKMDCEGKLWITLGCDEHIFPYRNPDAEHDLDPTDWCTNFTDIPIEEWGKTVFLTQTEAEQKLKEMESD